MRRGAARAMAVALLCGLGLLLGTAPAFAHAILQNANPADGTSLSTAPTSVSLTFNEDIPAEFTVMTVIGPDGAAYQSGPVSASNGTISTAVMPLGPIGSYRIGWRVVSDDGHPVSGSIAFTMTTAGTGKGVPPDPNAQAAEASADATPGAPGSSGGAPVWPWIVGAVVLVGAGVFAALRLGRN